MALQVAGGAFPQAVFSVSLVRLSLLQTLVMVMLCAACGPGLMAGTISRSLECRSGRQPWVVCRMVAPSPGERWVLEMDPRPVAFRHDGSGRMLMRRGDLEPWTSVEPRWIGEHTLCWGSVCARGDLPLD